MGWLSGWQYRKSVTLSRSAGAVTNYQMMVRVGQSSGASGADVHCHGNVRSDFNDLRFTKTDGTTLLDYWIESITGTSPNRLATVWVEFDAIETGSTTFYMYYGKSDASPYSNGDNTFLLFDDFLGTSLDTNKWRTWGNGGGTISVANSILTLTKAAPDGQFSVYSQNPINENGVRTRLYSRLVTGSSYGHIHFWKAQANQGSPYPPNHYRWSTYHSTPRWYYIRRFLNSAWTDFTTGNSPTLDTAYHIIQILDDGNNKSFFYDGTQYGSTVQDTTFTSGYVGMGVWSAYGATPQHLIDWITIGKYVNPEPAWGSWGSQEEGEQPPQGGVIMVLFD